MGVFFLSGGCSRGEVQIFEQSGHQPFFEEPDRFAETLSNWMASQR
jgi:pimeloyl-ACP methyl ester carboxylesterase